MLHELKFAITREDPAVEIEVARAIGARRALVVASGGCTTFALCHALPELAVTAYDLNPMQIAHMHARAAAISRGELPALGIDDPRPDSLGQRGAFEALFRVLRAAFVTWVAPEAEVERFFAEPGAHGDTAARWIGHRYWPAVFDAAFSERLLVAMFGPAAVQHAPPGSYPDYFADAFARGLRSPQAPHNRFLQHVLLQRWLGRDAPAWATSRQTWRYRTILSEIPDAPDLEATDLVHLSNIFDWSDDAAVSRWMTALRRLPAGAAITIRQLNNRRALPLAPHFEVDEGWSAALQAADQSLFYERILVARRTST